MLQLSKQITLPNRKRKGNLLNLSFLFFIGMVENLQGFEHRNFKMADLLQHRFVRKGLMLFTFLLFFLTSFEQAKIPADSSVAQSKVECVYQTKHSEIFSRRIAKHVIFQTGAVSISKANLCIEQHSPPFIKPCKLYLQNRCFLI